MIPLIAALKTCTVSSKLLCGAATGFSAKITTFTKKFTRSEKISLDLKFLRGK